MTQNQHAIDAEILRLISRRINLLAEEMRTRGDGDLFAADIRARVLKLIESLDEAPPPAVVEAIFAEILSCAMTLVTPFAVAFLGPEGTFTEAAVHGIFGRSIQMSPQRSIEDVFREVESGRARYGVVPIENSTEGSVTSTLDELLETDLQIIGEHYLRIVYSLLARGGTISEVRRIYAHAQSVGQCKGWLRAHCPRAEIVTVDSTARAAELAAEEEGAAALASSIAGEKHGLKQLATAVEDSRRNFTRFVVMGSTRNRPTGNDKTSIVCAVRDRPGALLEILKPLSERGINMTRIESRPDKKKMWEYNFFIDFTGHRDDPQVVLALERIREGTIFLKILGSYPAGS